MTLNEFNQLDTEAAIQVLLKACHCRRWAGMLSAARPFESVEVLQDAAANLWASASKAMILEAFAGHPRIGDKQVLRDKYSREGNEQGRVREANEDVIDALAQANEEYWQRFGFIFIVCASGKSADEMLALLLQRLANDAATELAIGAAEQGKITRLRLNTMFGL